MRLLQIGIGLRGARVCLQDQRRNNINIKPQGEILACATLAHRPEYGEGFLVGLVKPRILRFSCDLTRWRDWSLHCVYCMSNVSCVYFVYYVSIN